MKRIILFASILCLPFFSLMYGQTLSFSKGVNLVGHCGSGSHNIDTVPAAKLWKLENVALNNVTLGLEVPGGGTIVMTQYDYCYPIASPGYNSSSTMTQPFWLTSGQIIKAICNASAGDEYFLSILEFDVTP